MLYDLYLFHIMIYVFKFFGKAAYTGSLGIWWVITNGIGYKILFPCLGISIINPIEINKQTLSYFISVKEYTLQFKVQHSIGIYIKVDSHCRRIYFQLPIRIIINKNKY